MCGRAIIRVGAGLSRGFVDTAPVGSARAGGRGRAAGRGRAEGRAVTGGAEERFGREEEEVVRIVNREVVAGFWGLGGIDTPSFLFRGGVTGRASSLWSQGHLSSRKLNSRGS